MKETRSLSVNGKLYQVVLERFDDLIYDADGELEQAYRGFHVDILGDGVKIKARKYDRESSFHILSGLSKRELKLVVAVWKIGRKLFKTNRLSWL